MELIIKEIIDLFLSGEIETITQGGIIEGNLLLP